MISEKLAWTGHFLLLTTTGLVACNNKHVDRLKYKRLWSDPGDRSKEPQFHGRYNRDLLQTC